MATRPILLRLTTEMIATYPRGCPFNHPVAVALKEQTYPSATDILVHGDEIYVDGQQLKPSPRLIRWIERWEKGLPCTPSTQVFYE